VEVDEPAEGLPVAYGRLDAVIVERAAPIEPACEVVAGADVVSREDVQPAEAAQECVFRAPAADSAQPAERGERVTVVEALDFGCVERAGLDCRGEVADAACLWRR
jgi:hypothetical protein